MLELCREFRKYPSYISLPLAYMTCPRKVNNITAWVYGAEGSLRLGGPHE